MKGSTTLNDVINRIQAATTGLVTVAIDAAQKNLELTDTTTGPETFRVTALNNSLAGAPQVGLGLLGDEGYGGGVIAGAPLHGDALASHLSCGMFPRTAPSICRRRTSAPWPAWE